MSKKYINVPGRLHNVALDAQGNPQELAGANEIFDDTLGKDQGTINSEVAEALGEGGSVDSRISAAKAELKGNATSACDTLGEAETLILTETKRAQVAENLLQDQYEALTQSDIVVGTLPASGVAKTIYRVPGTTSYSDYMWNGSQFIKMAEYDNAIDDEPTAGSNNLVKSGGVASSSANMIGFETVLKLNVVSGTQSYQAPSFAENTFVHGTKLAFVVLDKNNVINKYAFITEYGATIDGTLSEPYRYSTNTIYVLDPSTYWATRKTRFFVNETNAIGTGSVTILCAASLKSLLKLIDDIDVKVDTLNVKVDTLSSKTLPLVDSIGFDNILSLEITLGSDSHTSLFPENTFTHGKKLAFIVLDKSNTINKYGFLTSQGATIDGTLDNPYRYEPNTIYMIDPSSWWATRKTMFYVNSSNILASGTVTILYSTSIEKLLKLIDSVDVSSAATPFAGKKYAVIGDSLSAGGIWEEKMSDITKAVYVSGYSQPGMATLTIGEGCNMDRALLLHQEQPNIDMIFVENINDSTQLGVIGQKTDVPFMLSQRVSSATVYTSSTEALAALATEIAAITPQLGTMLNVRYTSGSEIKNVSRCFISKDLSEWNDLSKWVHTYNVSLYSLYKGMYQYLKQNFPNALIFQLIFPIIVWGSSTPKMIDGNVDWDEYQDTIGLPALREFQIDVANYCNIPYIDVVTNCNINTYNASQFYPENDVHPNNNGYHRFGETIARIL